MSHYPPKHHPVFMLADALTEIGAEAVFNNRDERTLGTWGLIVNGKPVSWLIDNRWPHEAEKEDPAAKELLTCGALVCCAQKRDAERVGAMWLPLAATPEYLEDIPPRPRVYEASFVGYVRDGGRGHALSLVASRYVTLVEQGVFGQSAVIAYREAKCGVNIPTHYGDPLAYDVNMRVFEIAATGIPLVTNCLPELEALGFINNQTCFTYCNQNGVLGAIERAHHNPQAGQAGRELVLARHTYVHRAKQVLEWLDT